MILLVLFNLLLAGVFILNKKLSGVATPALFTGVRFIVAGIFFYIIQPERIRVFFTFVKNEFWWILYVGIGFAGGDILRTQALKVIPSSHASLLATSSPFVALVISYFILHELVTWRKIGGLLIGIIGLAPLLSKKIMGTHASLEFTTSYLLFLFSIACFVMGGTYSKKLSSKGYPLLSILAAVMSAAGIVGFITSFVTDGWNSGLWLSFVPQWQLVLCFIGAQNILGFFVYNYLVRHNSVTLVTFSNLLIPLFTSIILWWYQLETIEYEFFFAFGMLVIAFIVLMFPGVTIRYQKS